MNIRFYENPFAKNAQGISKIYHEVLLLIKFLQTLRQVKNLNIKYYDLYYTVIKTRDGKNIIDTEYENNFINFNDIVPIPYVGRGK